MEVGEDMVGGALVVALYVVDYDGGVTKLMGLRVLMVPFKSAK